MQADQVVIAIFPDGRSPVAVSPANYIYAATENGLYIIDGASGEMTHYGPYNRVAVAVDGTTFYLGTWLDLQVLDVSDPKTPKLIGDYVDPDMEFERSLSFDGVLTHTPRGIFMYRPDLLLEAQSPGVAVNSTPLPSGSSVIIQPGDGVSLAAGGSAAVKERCPADNTPQTKLILRQVASRKAQEFIVAAINGSVDPTLLGLWALDECKQQQSPLHLQAGPAPLPLSLASGGVQIEVPAITGAIGLDTANASSQATGKDTFRVGPRKNCGPT